MMNISISTTILENIQALNNYKSKTSKYHITFFLHFHCKPKKKNEKEEPNITKDFGIRQHYFNL